MYKILIRFTNKLGKNIWEVYGSSTTSTTGYKTSKEFETDDIEVLKEKIRELDKEFGHDDIRIIKDATYDVMVEVESTNPDDIQITTSADIKNIYNSAYAKVFSEE